MVNIVNTNVRYLYFIKIMKIVFYLNEKGDFQISFKFTWRYQLSILADFSQMN